MFIFAITSHCGLDAMRDALFEAIAYAVGRIFPGKFLMIGHPLPFWGPLAAIRREVAPKDGVEEDWEAIEEVVIPRLEQARKNGQHVLINDLGHAVMQRAAARAAYGDFREAEAYHHFDRVPKVVKNRGFDTPEYVRLTGSVEEIETAMLRCPGRAKSVVAPLLRKHVLGQVDQSNRYFAPEYGQRYHDIDIGLSLIEQRSAAMAFIMNRLNVDKLAA